MENKKYSFLQILLLIISTIAIYVKADCPDNGNKVLTMPNFKGSKFPCAYSGFIEIKKNQALFYYYFRNENASAEFPMLLWLNGGPGASSMTGLFEESGPLYFEQDENNEVVVKVRENSWLQYSHLLFVDQPVGTGFSYTDGEYIGTEEQVGSDFIKFLDKFIAQHQETANIEWNFFGESYGGKYTPWISKYIIENKLINLNKIGLIDPLVFALLQKTTTRNDVYGGLGIFDPPQLNQFNTMQERCAQGIYANLTTQTTRCSSIEDFMSNQTSLIDAKDVRNFTTGTNLINLYFNQQSPTFQEEVEQSMHISKTLKQRPNIFKTDPQVYQAFNKTNDIYGEQTITLIDDLLKVQKKPFMIMEGVMDTLDGILGLEHYKNWLAPTQCKPRQIIKYKKEGNCYPFGFTQDCSGTDAQKGDFSFRAVGVWSAGHLIPFDQLEASNFILKNYLNDGEFCDSGCDCSIKTMETSICSTVLNNCNNHGKCQQSGQSFKCVCDPGFYMADCSYELQSFDISQSHINFSIEKEWQFFKVTGFSKLKSNINNLEIFLGADFTNFEFYLKDTEQSIQNNQYYQYYSSQESIFFYLGTQQTKGDIQDNRLVLALRYTGLVSPQTINKKAEQSFSVFQRTVDYHHNPTYFLLDGNNGIVLCSCIFAFNLIILVIVVVVYKKKRQTQNSQLTAFSDKQDEEEDAQVSKRKLLDQEE